jgi:hypothetical protein
VRAAVHRECRRRERQPHAVGLNRRLEPLEAKIEERHLGRVQGSCARQAPLHAIERRVERHRRRLSQRDERRRVRGCQPHYLAQVLPFDPRHRQGDARGLRLHGDAAGDGAAADPAGEPLDAEASGVRDRFPFDVVDGRGLVHPLSRGQLEHADAAAGEPHALDREPAVAGAARGGHSGWKAPPAERLAHDTQRQPFERDLTDDVRPTQERDDTWNDVDARERELGLPRVGADRDLGAHHGGRRPHRHLHAADRHRLAEQRGDARLGGAAKRVRVQQGSDVQRPGRRQDD